MADEQHRPPVPARDLVHFPEAFLLELSIADGEHFVYDEDFRFQMSGDGEGQPDIHAGRITFDRRVEEFLDLSEGNYLVEFAADLGAGHTEDRAVEKDILAAGQFRMKPGANL